MTAGMNAAKWNDFIACATTRSYVVQRIGAAPLAVTAGSLGDVVAMLSRQSIAWTEIGPGY